MKDKKIAVSGSRDATLRVWNIEDGLLLHLLAGHQASVRCMEICGDIVVSGSYDCSARVNIYYEHIFLMVIDLIV
jgi:F-box and WD-40 domain protein CDC4